MSCLSRDIPSEVWDVTKNYGEILDSATSLTILATPAYNAAVTAEQAADDSTAG